jgi:hypothetical protein
MGAKELLLVASGVAIGYLLFKKDLFKRVEKATLDITEGAVTGVSDLVSPQISDPKTQDCEKKFAEFAQTIKPSSPEAFENIKKEFMINCLTKK